MFGRLRLGEVGSDQVGSGPFLLGPIGSGPVRSAQLRSGQVWSGTNPGKSNLNLDENLNPYNSYLTFLPVNNCYRNMVSIVTTSSVNMR